MADDRMLSDEILLGIINSKSGGGGGGTTDYSQLSNKPQINSVELSGNKSLSDLGIASASSVKTEFIGTTAEWNALTEEQKKAYDTYQITDDYTEGSGGLPDYSTTEQLTGQKWIDGKNVYFKTIVLDSTITVSANSWSAEFDLAGDRLVNISALNSIDNNVFPVGGNITNNKLSVVNIRNTIIIVDTFIVYYTKTA